MAAAPTNWAGNIEFGARAFPRPSTVAEVQRLVAGSDRIRALGTGHSFSRIADTDGDLISVAGLEPRIVIDPDRGQATISAGMRYGDVGRALQAQGFALHNTGSLPHISVAGACSTGTHGSGDHNGNLSTAVAALRLVTAGGDEVQLSRETEGERFNGMVLALGSLGIVVGMTLDIVPTFDVRQDVYDDLPREQLASGFDEVFGSDYSVSAFTDWTSPTVSHVWRKHRMHDGGDDPAPSTWLGARLADAARHPVPGMPATFATAQLGVPGPWNERLPHFRLDFTPSRGEELQTEYLLPREHAADAIDAVYQIGGLVSAVLVIGEIRTVAADELWLSPSYRQDSVALHFTWIPDTAAVTPVVTAVERQLAPFAPRPHWGKVFTTEPGAVAARYARMPDFRALVTEFDPTGKFRNDLVDRYVFATDAP